MLRPMARAALGRLMGRHRYQPFWELLHRLSLRGMNIASSGGPSTSGERWALSYLARQLPSEPSVIVLDVGANVGEYARQVISVLKERAQVYCFEPSTETYAVLSANLGHRHDVHLLNFGLSSTERVANLYSDSVGSGLASVYRRCLDYRSVRMDRIEQVQLRTIDAFCCEQGITRIHLLKLDVEGHELDVLSGARGMLGAGAVDMIQFEFGGCNIDSRTYFRDFFYLLNEHYTICRLCTDGLRPITEYHEACELFLTTNYLAVRRGSFG